MELYLVELKVSDWAASLAWYRDRLGLTVERLDEPHRYALMAAGQGRLALKAGSPAADGFKLVFQVPDLQATIHRLEQSGITAGPVRASPEGYRSSKISDPDGHTVELFEWAA